MRSIHLIGVLLWRGGLLLAGGWALVESMRLLLRLMDIPDELEVGVAFILGGFAMVLVSLVLERLRDARTEEGLHE